MNEAHRRHSSCLKDVRGNYPLPALSKAPRRVPEGGELMAHWDRRFLNELKNLLDDCGMPDRTPERELLQELYQMIEDHLQDTRDLSEEAS